LTAASSATKTSSSLRMPCALCSKIVLPKPWRATYGSAESTDDGHGSDVGDQNWPVSSSRRKIASPEPSPIGSLCHGVRRSSCAFSHHV